MTEQQPQKRVRIEVSTSTKGVHTYRCTVELIALDIAQGGHADVAQVVLIESDWLVAKLDERYPAPEA